MAISHLKSSGRLSFIPIAFESQFPETSISPWKGFVIFLDLPVDVSISLNTTMATPFFVLRAIILEEWVVVS